MRPYIKQLIIDTIAAVALGILFSAPLWAQIVFEYLGD
jgi:hypothetical protein